MPLSQRPEPVSDEVDDILLVQGNRMTGEVKTKSGLFLRQSLLLGPGFDRGDGLWIQRLRARFGQPKQIVLPAGRHGAVLFCSFQGIAEFGQMPGTVRIQTVQRTGADQGLDHPPVELAPADPAAEVGQAGEGAFTAPFIDQIRDGTLADPLDGTQTVLDGTIVQGREAELGLIDVGWPHVDLHLPALFDEDDHLVGLVHIR